MQCKHSSDSEGRCNQRRLRLYQIKSKFTGSRDGIGSSEISGKKRFIFVFFFIPFASITVSPAKSERDRDLSFKR